MALRNSGVRSLGLLAVGLLVAGCGQMIWKSSGHAAVAADKVQILTSTPAHYERLGTCTHLWTDTSAVAEGGDATAIFKDLLSEAGGMGANSLLLADDTTMADSRITVTYQGQKYALPVIAKTKTILAQALFVTRE